MSVVRLLFDVCRKRRPNVATTTGGMRLLRRPAECIVAVMLFANCVRALHVESTSMFVRGGVYRLVRRAMGGTLFLRCCSITL